LAVSFERQVTAVADLLEAAVLKNPTVSVSLNSTYGDEVERAAAEVLKERGYAVATWGGLLYSATKPSILESLTRLKGEVELPGTPSKD
jgi:biotin carboxylase